MRNPLMIIAALAVAVSVTGCGGESPEKINDSSPVTTKTQVPAAQRAVSKASGELVVRREPSESGAVLTRLSATTQLGSPRVLAVQKVAGGWVQVGVPTRPNGGLGWVASSDVSLEDVTAEVRVSLADRRLEYSVNGKEVASTPVAVGSTENPTPRGRFFVTDRVRPTNTRGPYGVFALGLSGYSETLSEFGNGDGQIGIHGTNQPSSIGQAVSHGCVRVPNKIATILEQVPLGTPVVIE